MVLRGVTLPTHAVDSKPATPGPVVVDVQPKRVVPAPEVGNWVLV